MSEPSYAVHRPSEAGPSSPQSPGLDSDDEPNTPPPYSGPTTSSMSLPQPAQSQLCYPGLPRLEYKLYTPEAFTLSADSTTVTSYEPRYSTHPNALVSLIKSLATVPPKPQIRIVGTGVHGTIDFDVKLNLMNLIVTDDVKNRMNYVKIIGPGDVGFRGETTASTLPSLGSLEEWVRRFCEDAGPIKQ
jgi:hypothetical protein